MDNTSGGPLLTTQRALSLLAIERAGVPLVELNSEMLDRDLKHGIGDLLTDARPRVVILGELHRTVSGERVELRRGALVVLLRPEDAQVGEYVCDELSSLPRRDPMGNRYLQYRGVDMAFTLHRIVDGDTEYRIWQRIV
jgi:hypothetical protein